MGLALLLAPGVLPAAHGLFGSTAMARHKRCRGATKVSGEDSSRFAHCASVELLSQAWWLEWELSSFLEQE